MHELRLVAVSEDGSYAILAVPGRGGRFSLPIDDRLRTVARGHFSRLAQYEIEVENPLRPKEIQDRIRAGETAEEIADAAGIPIERVRRFEGPVLAERDYRAQEAQKATVRSPGESGPGPQLGDLVAERLIELGASSDDANWDSRKRADGNWQVKLTFSVGSRTQVAEWIFDPRRRHIAPDDDLAARLCLPEPDLAPIRFPGPATATVTPIAPRLGVAPVAGQPVVGQPVVGQPMGGQHVVGQHALPEQRGAPSPPAAVREPGPAVPPAAAGQHRDHAGVPSVTPAAVGQLAPDAPAERRAAEADPAADAGRQEPARGRPARKAAGGRSRRASVPSWDEIMFGNSRQPE
jgi:hypothetical protein